MHNPESIQEKERQKILCDFDIPADNLISAKHPDFVIVK